MKYTKIFPVDSIRKTPLTEHGFKDATVDESVVKQWMNDFPNCGWATPTGGEFFVVDVDNKKDGLANWQQLLDKYGKLDTYTVQTQHGGMHLYFITEGRETSNSTGKIGEGIDVRGKGGYVVIPPTTGYTVINDVEPIAAPEWILELVTRKDNAKTFMETHVMRKPDYEKIMAALAKLSQVRKDSYQDWLEVGMALHSEGDEFLSIWDVWSRKGTNYEPGVCAEKWNSFTEDKGKTIASIYFWALEDSKDTTIIQGGKHPKPSEYKEVWKKLGYTFSMNEMNDRIYVNGTLMSDAQVKHIMTTLRENNYPNSTVFEDAMVAEAFEHQFHPIRDYLTNLKWNGEDNIGKLSTFFKDKDNLFPMLIRKWLVGAVNRILRPAECRENPMLVLDGKQGKGKSFFVAWLGSVLPEYHKVSPINPDNKDMIIDSVSYFVWEVDELGSTFRKADREALKAFIMRPTEEYRSPYGRYPCKKSTISSYIGTLNDEGGFLNDPTGNRRYRVCTLKNIDWGYTQVDINQVWAQAVELSKMGETCNFSEEEELAQNKVNERYEVDEPLNYYMDKYFDIDSDTIVDGMPIAGIIEHLNKSDQSLRLNAIDKVTTMSISKILTRYGLSKEKRTVDGGRKMVWRGIRPKSSQIEVEAKKNVDNLFRKGEDNEI